MLHLLGLEWKKIRYYRTFQVLVVLFIIALPGIMMIPKTFSSLPDEIISKDMFYMFPNGWKFFGYVGNWLAFFFLGFLAVISATTEYANKTLRQNIITGLSRRQFFSAKLSFIIAISLAATLYYTFVCLLFGFTHTETIYMSKVFQEADLIPRFFLMCLGYTSFGLLVGLLIRRTGIALFLYLSYVMIIELILRYPIHMRFFTNRSIHFYPMNAIEDLVPIDIPPFNQLADEFMDENNFSFFLTPTEAVITSSFYIGLFLLGSYLLLEKRDL
ncbi:MAG: ABC transporter permease [Bacteroidota bacterium]